MATQVQSLFEGLSDDMKLAILDFADTRPIISVDAAIDDGEQCEDSLKQAVEANYGFVVETFDDLLANDAVLKKFVDMVAKCSGKDDAPFISGRQFSSDAPDATVKKATIQQAYRESLALRDAGGCYGARMGDGEARRTDANVRGDSVAWLHLDAPAAATPSAQAIIRRIELVRQRINAIKGEEYFTGFEAQLAIYGKGARYTAHMDAISEDTLGLTVGATTPSYPHRKLTFLVYLNPDWTAADGGNLWVHRSDKIISLLPKEDRFLCFPSLYLEHEVRVAHRERSAIATWHRAEVV